MNIRFKAILLLTLAGCMLQANAVPANAEDSAATQPKKAAKKEPTVSEQIQELRDEFQNKINALQQEIADRDAKLAAAQAQAAAAQTQASDAAAKADSVSSSIATDNEAVSKLSSAVDDMKASSTSMALTVQDTQKSMNAAMSNPDTIHYKGITISPAGSFIEAATVDRTAAIGDDINTHWTSVPLQAADGAQMSEFYGSGRQSRIALKATGKLANATMTGYYEMDWLGAGVTSNNNQSNSYVVRERQLWARAEFTNGMAVSAGAMWSLATETTQGVTNGTEILPSTIDAAYTPGFVWTRQFGFRVYKDFGHKLWLAASAENAEMLNPAGSGLPTNYSYGVTGDTGGLYNNQSNYSFNKAPDFVAKLVAEPGWGHWELFGIQRTFRDRIYPTSPALPYNSTRIAGGIGGGFRGTVDPQKKITVGLKGLYGVGVGRYGDSTIADVTVLSTGVLEPLHGFSSLATVEAAATKKLTLYFNYGGDYINRDYLGGVGYGSPLVSMTGCNTEVAGVGGSSPTAPGPSGCGANTKDVQSGVIGYWYNFYNGPMGRFRQGIQYSYTTRNLWSGTGGGTNPNGGAKGVDNMVFTSLRYYLP